MLQVRQIDVFHGEIQALWGVSLTVGQGESVALIGSNGAGKTSIVESIAGLNRPRAGEISFNGVPLQNQPTHKVVEAGISLIPEEKGIFPQMSVLENLEMGAFLPASRREQEATLEQVFELFPRLAERREQQAGTMSGGEQQMLAIGRALMSKPKLLIFDEPSLGLAPVVVKAIFQVIRRIEKAGVGVLLVEQNVRAALDLTQRAYILENGRITGEGPSAELSKDDAVRKAYLGTH